MFAIPTRAKDWLEEPRCMAAFDTFGSCGWENAGEDRAPTQHAGRSAPVEGKMKPRASLDWAMLPGIFSMFHCQLTCTTPRWKSFVLEHGKHGSHASNLYGRDAIDNVYNPCRRTFSNPRPYSQLHLAGKPYQPSLISTPKTPSYSKLPSLIG